MSAEAEALRKLIVQYQDPNKSEANTFEPSDLPSVNDVLLAAGKDDRVKTAKEAPGSRKLSDDLLSTVTTEALAEVADIEEAARNPARWNISPELARQTKLIVDFSAPGTYYRPVKDDRYKGNPWSWGMDRYRSDLSAIVGIHLAGIATGRDLSAFTHTQIFDGVDDALNNLRDKAQQAVRDAGIRFMYAGTPAESQAIQQVLKARSLYIPKDSVDVFEDMGDRKITNTVDQVKVLKQYIIDANLPPGSNILMVMGTQAVRALRIMEQFQAIPPELTLTIFPEATPKNGLKEYPTNEIKGTFTRMFLHEASPRPTSAILLGRK